MLNGREEEIKRLDGWGYKDSGFAFERGDLYFRGDRYSIKGNAPLPHAREWAEAKFDVDLHIPSLPPEATLPANFPPVNVPDGLMKELQERNFVFSVEGKDRLRHSHGQTLKEIFNLRNGKLPDKLPDLVVWPENHDSIEKFVCLAGKWDLVIIPFGGGTSVSGAVSCPKHESRTIAALATTYMNRLLKLDRLNLTVSFEAGIVGKEMERILHSEGYTTGHEPDSYEFSTLGGWVATRASGMKKNMYGNIEDLLIGARMVTPKGCLQKLDCIPRISSGPDFTHFILGSEGTLGVITEVTLKIRPYPAYKKYNSFVFRTFEIGLQCMREIAAQRCQPSSIRLMDNEQFQFGQALRQPAGTFAKMARVANKIYLLRYRKFHPHLMSVMTTVFEAPSLQELTRQEERIKEIVSHFGGIMAGERNGELGYRLTYVIAYLRDLALTYNIVAESFETSVPWSETVKLCKSVKDCVQSKCQEFGVRKFMTSCRITQIYDTGCCVYFYFGFNWIGMSNPVAIFESVENAARMEILKCGGSVSHHHGVGKIRSKFYPQISPFGAQLYSILKENIDPKNTFGVGNLLPSQL